MCIRDSLVPVVAIGFNWKRATPRAANVAIGVSLAVNLAMELLGVRLPENYGEYAAGFDALYPRLATELEVPFVPFYMEGVGGVPEMNLEDGLHPTAAGHVKLAETVAPGLAAVLAALPAGE